MVPNQQDYEADMNSVLNFIELQGAQATFSPM